MLKLTNTLTGTVAPFAPMDGTPVRMYTCGPTVYHYVHIGNFRAYVFEDVLRLQLRILDLFFSQVFFPKQQMGIHGNISYF